MKNEGKITLQGIENQDLFELTVVGTDQPFQSDLRQLYNEGDTAMYEFKVQSEEKRYPRPITVHWKIPAINVKGVWKPSTDFNKRIQADWELDNMESRISIDAPVISLFGHNDENIFTFACSDAIHKLEMNARLREEDNCFHCHITFFTEQHYALDHFKVQLRFDYRDVHFSESLREVSKWWESFDGLRPAQVPDIALKPLYSTWYQFHQNLDLELLLKECRMAHDIGYRTVIVDDGWQTNDNNRGYDYTGDWQPDRFPDMANVVAQIHKTGMKVGIWYSVPFCGKKSKAYQRFEGKFLTEDHRWAPVFDPRYPEVREHLVGLYSDALKDWNLDGFKLDFIDEFKLYPDTALNREDGRDFASINEAVDRLLTDVQHALHNINPDVFIEFRQKYTGPAMRKYGNMFRAFDCPGDATMNRLRIADIRMLAGNTAVHADMVTWHRDEPLEIAALQVINTLFGVPQLSIMLSDAPKEYVEMVAFYTRYWNENAETLTQGSFVPSRPLSNYPTQRVSKNGKTIIGIYEPYLVEINDMADEIHILNGQIADRITLRNNSDYGDYNCSVYDCKGVAVQIKSISFSKGLVEIAVPPCGIVVAKQITL